MSWAKPEAVSGPSWPISSIAPTEARQLRGIVVMKQPDPPGLFDVDEPALAPARLHADSPLRVPEVDVPGHRPAIGTDHIQQAVHVTDEEASCPRLLDERHQARGNAVDHRY